MKKNFPIEKNREDNKFSWNLLMLRITVLDFETGFLIIEPRDGRKSKPLHHSIKYNFSPKDEREFLVFSSVQKFGYIKCLI